MNSSSSKAGSLSERKLAGTASWSWGWHTTKSSGTKSWKLDGLRYSISAACLWSGLRESCIRKQLEQCLLGGNGVCSWPQLSAALQRKRRDTVKALWGCHTCPACDPGHLTPPCPIKCRHTPASCWMSTGKPGLKKPTKKQQSKKEFMCLIKLSYLK